ncbi:MAG: hypothetical protein HY270_09385 [Deltaproteobacteria bacterium]|nr:hypothetical protein [Deltaproteobacteria bacterium]
MLPHLPMLGAVDGPWLCVAALLLVTLATAQGPLPRARTLWHLGLMTLAAAALRLTYGLWGPLHVNGQGPLWIRGALEPAALAGYGPGYFELLSWSTRLGIAPDRTVFASNAVLSALSPVLLFSAARLSGIGQGGALGAALVLSADAVTIRTSASEGYFAPLIALTLGVQAALALGLAAAQRHDRRAVALSWTGAGLLAAAAARIHPMSYLPLALSPLVVFGGSRSAWPTRLRLTVGAGLAIGIVVLLTSGRTIHAALSSSQMTARGIAALTSGDAAFLLAFLLLWLALRRWVERPWLPLLGIFSLLLMLATQASFQEHVLQKLSYQRLFWPGLLLGAAALLPRRMQGLAWAAAGALVTCAVLLFTALPYLQTLTTEQLEYRFLQTVLARIPTNCTVTSVTHAGLRLWEMPSYLVPSLRPGGAPHRSLESDSDLRDTIRSADCVVYIHSSLCSSTDGRPLCEAQERDFGLEEVTRQTFPARPSFAGLPYDRPEVEVVVWRSHKSGTRAESAPATVSDGAPITPALATLVYQQIVPLRQADGCSVARLDTSRFRLKITLRTADGVELAFEVASGRAPDGRQIGAWTLAAPADIERRCKNTLAAIERALGEIDPATVGGLEPTV